MNDMSFGLAILCAHILTVLILYNFLMKKDFFESLKKTPVPILVVANNRHLIIFPKQTGK